MAMALYYLHVEAVNLAHFVYDTHDISTIRGGSFLLWDAIQQLATAPAFVHRLRPVATAASQGLFAFESEIFKSETDASALIVQVLGYLHTQTGGHATFLAAVQPDDPEHFPLVLEKLQAQIRRQQWRTPTVMVPAFASAAEECYLDGWRPGVADYRVDEDVENAQISEATAFRRKQGQAIKHRIFYHLLGNEKYQDNLSARDLGELATAAGKGILNGKIAFIHIDGNSFGRIRRALCSTAEARTRFDQAIQAGCREPFLQSLLQRADGDGDYKTVDSQGRQALRIEVLLWGGDEMTLVVPAWRGWQLLELYYTHASRLLFDGVELSQRAAIVFAHHNAPILQIRKIASDLLDQARRDIQSNLERGLQDDPAFVSLDAPAKAERLARLADHRYGNAIRYLVLESFDMLRGSLPHFLEKYYKGIGHGELLLQAHELAFLRQNLALLRAGVARSRVLAIVHSLQAGDSGKVAQLSAGLVASTLPAMRADVAKALDNLNGRTPSLWYLLADLWDYIPEWTA